MKKRILSFFLALFTVIQLVSMIPVVAQDQSVVGATVKFRQTISQSNVVYCYKDVTYSGTSTTSVRVDSPTMLPEVMKILDTLTSQEGTTYYQLGTVDASSHEVLDTYPWINAALLEILSDGVKAQPTVTLNGKAITEVTLYTNSKMPLVATMPAEFTGNVLWGWEILVDAEKELWVRIGDKVTNVCQLTYALVKNTLNKNNITKLRAVAIDGDSTYYADPITVTVKNQPGTVLPFFDKVYTEAGGTVQNPSIGAEMVTITVNYIKIRPDGTRVKAAYENVRTLKIGYEAYEITPPTVLGYYPSLEAPSNPYDFSKNPPQTESIDKISVEAGYTTDRTINVYYYPGQAQYKVIHYLQKLDTDEYEKYSENSATATVDKPVPDCHQNYVGFQHLYYEHTEVAVDGSTVIEVYYEREYHTVIFDLVHQGAYGQESLYVKYGTNVSANNPTAMGWLFDGWCETDENGTLIDPSAEPVMNLTLTVQKSVYYKASYHGVGSSYTVVYWFENADDGYYTIRYTEEYKNGVNGATVTSGDFATWNGIVPQYITDNYNDLEFFTFDEGKTEEANRTLINPETNEYRDGVVIQGDGSTTVDVYFARRFYKITFVAATPKTGGHLEEHTHGDGSCIFNPMYCVHRHTADCRTNGDCGKEEHIHTAACRSCTITEHIHGPSCCSEHVHTVACYDVDSDLTEGFKKDASNKIKAYLDDRYGNIPLIGNIISTIVNWFVNERASSYAAEYAEKLQSAAPPQNLQSGYIYVLEQQDIEIVYDGWLININDTIKMDIPAVYINGEWYYYTAPAGETPKTGDIAKTDATVCTNHNHDHSGGCDYSQCTIPEHVHTDSTSYTCGKTAHTHSAYCNCTHIHEYDCYNSYCMRPEHSHANDGATDESGYQVVRTLVAKYGQNITSYVPYYLELEDMGLNKNANGESFTYWKYDSTGTDASKATDRYVKHMTMVPELCYSNGIRTVAQYSADVSQYVLFYLFESLDQTSGTKAFDYSSGNARQELGGTYYDSDPAHMQVIMLDNENPNALAQLNKEANKTIYGMTPSTLTGNPSVDTIELNGTNVTQYACFYDRLSTQTVLLHNNGVEIFTFGEDVDGSPLKYGTSLKDVMERYQASNQFDYLNIPLPSGFEVGAWEFAGWYTTPTINPDTKVDWDSATLPIGELNLFGLWKPVTRHVEVYEDYTLEAGKLLTTVDLPNGNTLGQINYSASSYISQGYTFAGWFYLDDNGKEQRFYVNSFPVRRDMKIYAKWKMDKMVPFQINFVYKDENGNEFPIADSLVGNQVAGQNHTFFALTGTALKPGYEEGYFPQVSSHTLMMKYEENPDGTLKNNTFTFYYDKVEEVSYTIYFVDENGAHIHTYHTKKTRKAAVTELFLPIENYTPKSYSKQLILSPNNPEANVIIFEYTENVAGQDIKLFYHVHHMLENEFGGYDVKQTREQVETVPAGTAAANYPIGFAKQLAFANYKFTGKVTAKTRAYNAPDSHIEQEIEIPMSQLKTQEGTDGQIEYGYQLNDFGIEFYFYYDREDVGYTVVYKGVELNNGEIVSETEFHKETVSKEISGVAFGDFVTVEINEQKRREIVMQYGYDLYDDTKTSIKLYLDVDESKNVVEFLFTKFDASFDYVVVGYDGAGALDNTHDDTAAGGDGSSLHGSQPNELTAYYFAGWFADAECKKPINAETIVSEGYAVTLDSATNKLMPKKTSITYTPDGGASVSGELYLSDTYYALFLPRRAELTVTVDAHPSDSFLLTFVGRSGTLAEGTTFTVAVISGQTLTVTGVSVGIYDVTLDTNWSWRYAQLEGDNASVEVKVREGGKLELFVGTHNNQWMTDSTSGSYVVPQNP